MYLQLSIIGLAYKAESKWVSFKVQGLKYDCFGYPKPFRLQYSVLSKFHGPTFSRYVMSYHCMAYSSKPAGSVGSR